MVKGPVYGARVLGDFLINRREREMFPSCAACRGLTPIGLARGREAAKRLFPFSREGEGYGALSEGLGIVG